MLRQINDPYVEKAKKEGYKSRAAFKLIEIQDKFKIIKNNSIVIDLGAAPGGWSQVASKICNKIIAVDLLDMAPIPKVNFIKGDFLEETTMQKVMEIMKDSKADVVLSDMAPSSCGIKKVDHLRIVNLIEAVYEFCKISLNEGGTMVAKIFQGGAEAELLTDIKLRFSKVVHFKPNSSRKESVEMYLVATGFKNGNHIS
jgi:23S rRNA (uridine2552-2'-O)-methyltransferase